MYNFGPNQTNSGQICGHLSEKQSYKLSKRVLVWTIVDKFVDKSERVWNLQKKPWLDNSCQFQTI